MRYVIYGAGAIGGTIGGRLAQHGHEVVSIARGAHAAAIRDHGLRLVSPDDDMLVRVPCCSVGCTAWTPVNTMLRRVANELARERRPPGSLTVQQLISRIE